MSLQQNNVEFWPNLRKKRQQFFGHLKLQKTEKWVLEYIHTSQIVQQNEWVERSIISLLARAMHALWVFRVLKYPKKCLEDLTMFFMSTWWGDSKKYERNWIVTMAFWVRYLQNSTVNSAYLAAHFCLALVCPQKATVRIKFLPYFWNPLIKCTWKLLSNPSNTFLCISIL